MDCRKLISETLEELADALEDGRCLREPLIAVCDSGSELGTENVLDGCRQAVRAGQRVLYIGPGRDDSFECMEELDPEKAHTRMEELLASGYVQAAVTMHYPFPVGVTTVGRAVTPSRGRPMFIASTTGSASANRVEAMLENCVCGLAAARACGIARPTVGIANIDGAKKTEMILRNLRKNGWDFDFTESARGDGGVCMRGNDVLTGTPDILLCDSLTGNLLMKILSAFQSGGNFETIGWGYGPGMGRNFSQLVMIVSRASGAPVIAGAVRYASELLRGNWLETLREEYKAADLAGLRAAEASLHENAGNTAAKAPSMPPKEILDCGILGVDVSEMETAVHRLWSGGIYAEGAMGCTGPVIMVNAAKEAAARELLRAANLIE